MKQCAVTDRNIIADAERIATGVVRPGMRHVQHRAILNIGSCADTNDLNVAAHSRMWPNAGVVTQMDVAHDNRCRINHDPITQPG
jgi:hypothetical protein